MRAKLLFIVAVLIIAATLAQAQPLVPITVDTLVYLGKTENREAKGAFFLPDGNIIAVWGDTPLIVDSKSGKILRRLDSLPNKDVQYPKLSKNCRYLIAYSTKGTAIWDVLTGKILKFIQIANDYAFSPDGLRMYCTNSTSVENPGLIRVYDMNTLEETERFLNKDYVVGDRIAISPDGQTLAVSVGKKPDNDFDKKTNHVILINLNDKNNYTVLEQLEPAVYSMEFSPDGKYLMYRYVGSYDSKVYIYIYNLETKEKIYLNQSDLAKLHDIKDPAMYDPFFLNGNTILIPISNFLDLKQYSYIWNIPNGELKKIIYFGTSSIDMNDDKLLLCSYSGALAMADSEYVSIKEDKITNDSLLIFSNNQLVFNSDKSFAGLSMIYDTTGKLIDNLGTQPFIAGKNIIRVNQTMPIGVYILTIKSSTEQISKKFIVE